MRSMAIGLRGGGAKGVQPSIGRAAPKRTAQQREADGRVKLAEQKAVVRIESAEASEAALLRDFIESSSSVMRLSATCDNSALEETLSAMNAVKSGHHNRVGKPAATLLPHVSAARRKVEQLEAYVSAAEATMEFLLLEQFEGCVNTFAKALRSEHDRRQQEALLEAVRAQVRSQLVAEMQQNSATGESCAAAGQSSGGGITGEKSTTGQNIANAAAEPAGTDVVMGV